MINSVIEKLNVKLSDEDEDLKKDLERIKTLKLYITDRQALPPEISNRINIDHYLTSTYGVSVTLKYLTLDVYEKIWEKSGCDSHKLYKELAKSLKDEIDELKDIAIKEDEGE